jgi:hypothetical protein
MRTRKLLLVTLITACGADDTADDTANTSTLPPPTQSAGTTSDTPTSTGDAPTTAAATSIDPASTSTSSSDTGTTSTAGCGACNEPNQQCIDDVCVTGCQGQDPDPCGPAQVCDVVSGECVDPGTACAVAGPSELCGDSVCAAGTVCDGQGACLAVAPCGLETCTSQGVCWGSACQCERGVTCSDPATDLLNGPFSAHLFGLDFADDCTAWGVTISGGQEFVRRLTSAGEYTVWGAIGDYDLGEVRVLRQLTVPQRTVLPDTVVTADTPTRVEGYGEVAVTYVCCPTCGDCANNPLARGVSRLVEEDPNMPLPIVIPAEATQGTGPFGNVALDGGPQGLTWGNDRVLYVGNTSANGQFETADLEAGTVAPVLLFADRTTASAAVSPVHLLVAVHPGTLYLLNTVTMESEFVVDLMSGVTSLSHDAFNGDVYASLANLEVVRVRPFTGDVEPFAVMPVIGRVAVSPAGNLWFAPAKYLNNVPLASWPLPTSL